MKIFFNVAPKNGPWGGGNLMLLAFHEYVKFHKDFQIVTSLDDSPDIIFVMNLMSTDYGCDVVDIIRYVESFPETYIVHRVNECDARKNTSHVDKMISDFGQWADLTVFVSNWMKEYHIEKGWDGSDSCVIYNGVDENHFCKNKKIKNGKINIVTHHWSDNVMKGFDVYNAIDNLVGDDITFTYIGRERGSFKNTRVISPLYGRDLGKELGKYDLYISGSRFDPGPNHILESLSCEIPTYVHKDGGGAVEFAGVENTYSDVYELVERVKENCITFNARSISLDSWNMCVQKYFLKIGDMF